MPRYRLDRSRTGRRVLSGRARVATHLGARRAGVGQGADVTWVVMTDPVGNEFDVLRALTPEELAGEPADEPAGQPGT